MRPCLPLHGLSLLRALHGCRRHCPAGMAGNASNGGTGILRSLRYRTLALRCLHGEPRCRTLPPRTVRVR